MSILNRTILATTLFAAAPLASAGSDTATMQVSIDIVNSCTIEASNMAFTATNVDAAATSTASLTVDCSSPSEGFQVALNGGGSGDIDARQMSGPGGATIDYGLYTDSGHSTVWGDGNTGQLVAGTSTGEDQTLTVYGQVPAQGAKPVGNYSDSITATVTF